MYGSTSIFDLDGNIRFIDNTVHGVGGGALDFESSTAILTVKGNVLFAHNDGSEYGGAIQVYRARRIDFIGDNTIFSGNSAQQGGAIWMIHITEVTLNGSIIFIDNNTAQSCGGAIYALRSRIRMNKEVIFFGNSAEIGGALYLTQDSVCFLSPSVMVLFERNKARKNGGGVFIDDSGYVTSCISKLKSNSLTLRPQCPFQYNKNYTEYILLDFTNNSASLGGSAIYGGGLDICNDAEVLSDYSRSGNVNISNIIKLHNATDPIASDPNRVCTCTKNKSCDEFEVAKSVYSGQTIVLPVLAIGQRNGVVPAVIQAHSNTSEAKIWNLENTQNTSTHCSYLSYTVLSGKNFTLTLSVDGICSTVGQNLTVKVEILQCPPGFDLSTKSRACICQRRLSKYTNGCNISDQTIGRVNKHFLVGYSNNSNNSNLSGLILHPYCPFDYCTTSPISFTLSDADKQCNYNRTGILCGQCKPGFSLVLGSSVCLDSCSNAYISLVVVFAVAGFALVIFLFTLQLTISTGAINGLIFYANMIHIKHIKHMVFFHSKQNNILTVFISWINLDLGIDTCFYREMNTYEGIWLRFVFPFYIWILCILSRKSPILTALLGNNPVAVLATLFLLSYTKILHTITAALSFTQAEYPHNESKTVWLYDANVPIAKWLPLAVFSVVMFFLLFPYTLFLFSNQWLLAWSGWHLLSWMNSPRIKFFLDAHNAPFKSKYRYWTGLLLIGRLLVQIVFAVNVLGNPALDILAISIVAASLAAWQSVWGSPYTNTWISILEVSFIVNILFLAVTSMLNSLQLAAILIYLATYLRGFFYLPWDCIISHLSTYERYCIVPNTL